MDKIKVVELKIGEHVIKGIVNIEANSTYKNNFNYPKVY